MEYVKLPGIDAPLSRFIYGTANHYLMDVCDESGIECLDQAWENGFRAFDSANSYGLAEKNLGRWIARRGRREQMVLIAKGCNPGQHGSKDVFSGQTIREQLKKTLDHYGTSYVDYYILHRDDPSKPVDEIVETLNQLTEEGKIRAFGGSNWSLERILQVEEYAKTHGLRPFSIISPCYSLADFANDPWGGSITLSKEENKPFRDYLTKNQMPVVNYSALARGFLSGKYKSDNSIPIEKALWWGPIQEYYCPENVARLARAEKMAAEKGATVSQISLAWLLRQPMNLLPLISPSSEKHMKECVEAERIILTDDECRWLYIG